MSKFEVTSIKTQIAENFWDMTDDASIFMKPSVLNKMSCEIDWWGCYQNSTLVAVWPICRNELNKVYAPDFTYYVGILFSNTYQNQPNHRKLAYTNSIYESFIQKFKNEYKYITFSNSTNLTDARFFLWKNHDNNSDEKYIITPRYTAQITKITESTIEDIAANFRPARRRHVKNALRQEFFIKKSKKTDQLDAIQELYKSTLDRQNKPTQQSTLDQIARIIQEIPEENSLCIEVYSPIANKLAFFSLLLYEKKIANLVINLTNIDYRDTNVSSLGILECIRTAKELGCDTFDFNGANSPNRADDKHSYGAEEKLFFQIDGTF